MMSHFVAGLTISPPEWYLTKLERWTKFGSACPSCPCGLDFQISLCYFKDKDIAQSNLRVISFWGGCEPKTILRNTPTPVHLGTSEAGSPTENPQKNRS